MSETVLQTVGLTKYFKDKLAVDHLSLKIEKGSVCGFLGRNGAGKTTAIRMMMGLLGPTEGSAELLGCDCQNLTPKIRQRIGYVTEGHRLFRWMSIGELEKFQKAFFPKQWDEKLFDDMIEYFDLSKKQKIKSISNGQRAQVSLALTIAPNPELLIMDDPTLGLDAAIRRQFLEGMIQLIMRQGRTILFSSHILADIERVADRIVVVDKGVLKADCTVEEFRNAIKKVVFTFEKDAPAEIDIDGLLRFRTDGNVIETTLINTTDEQIKSWAKGAGAIEYNYLKLSLEDQFIDFTEPNKKGKLFDWEKN
ncbi:MAG: ABC transporter ATP-binding protein [Anaerohalosphaeraceae bacterium]|nr:ABC transporter ATP-binding protein [Anaerohalosphaeraceae bacterium]